MSDKTPRVPFQTVAQVIVGSLIALMGAFMIPYGMVTGKPVPVGDAVLLMAVGLAAGFSFNIRTLLDGWNDKGK